MKQEYSYDGLFSSGGGNSSDDIRSYPYVAHLDLAKYDNGVCRYKLSELKHIIVIVQNLMNASGRSRNSYLDIEVMSMTDKLLVLQIATLYPNTPVNPITVQNDGVTDVNTCTN